MDDYLVGTGGWAYLRSPGESPLKAYSKLFNFTEVNYTFYSYPQLRVVENWRRTVPRKFTFAVRCHRDLTHRIGLKPLDTAYEVLGKMIQYCGVLEAPFLVLETPASCSLTGIDLDDAEKFLSSVDMHGIRLVWEYRAPITPEVSGLMKNLGIVHAVDLSKDEKSVGASDVVYSRLFGKGQMNLYQFTDEELVNIDRKVLEGLASGTKIAALSYHGARMNTDAIRFVGYKKTGRFLPATPFVGIKSVESVLSEDAKFPTTTQQLKVDQGWKVVDLKEEKRIHLSELLTKLPERRFDNLTEVLSALEAVV